MRAFWWAALLALAGCQAEEAPPCPNVSILAPAQHLARYRPGGHDLTDLQLDGQMVGVTGACSAADSGRVLRAHLSLTLDLTRGPAAAGRVAAVPYFVALTRGGTILDKQNFVETVRFPPNTDAVHVDTGEIHLAYPLSGPADYRIRIGFLLTPAEFSP